MDRISALRNVEDALADFESGDASLDDVEHRVLGVLRTYATEFEAENVAAFRATDGSGTEVVVVAPTAETARSDAAEQIDTSPSALSVERLD